MHSFYPYVNVRDEDRFQYGSPLSNHLHQVYTENWTPVDPALCNFQFEQQHKQLNHEFPQFQQLTSAYHISPPYGFEGVVSRGQLASWSSPVESYRQMRYNSPGGHFGGSMSESSSDYAISPDVARQQMAFSPPRYISPPAESQFIQQTWTTCSSFMLTPTSTPVSTEPPSIAMKELEFPPNPEFQLEVQEDDMRTQVPINAPEELELSESVTTFTTSSKANTRYTSGSQCDSESSVSSPAIDNDSDSDFDPKRRSARSTAGNKQLNIRSPRRTSSSYPVIDPNNRVHKQPHPRSHVKQEKSKPRPLPQLNNPSNPNVKAPKSFPCTFHTFGCPATFANKNEWKRHITSQHLQLGFYRCDLGTCNPDNNPQPQVHQPHGLGLGSRGRGHNKRRSISTPNIISCHNSDIDEIRIYNDFNRKDLFTQHCRRMHGPSRHLLDNTTRTNQTINARLRAQGRKLNSPSGKPLSTKDDEATFEEELDHIRARCWTAKRNAPERSSCGFCGKLFEAVAHISANDLEGKAEERAWEERMEHLGKHYERDGCSPGMEGVDPDLMEWGLREGILVKIEGVGAWLVGYDVNSLEHKEEDDANREVSRRRGPRRKVSNNTAVGGTKMEYSLHNFKHEEDDEDAMAEDD